MKIPIEIYISYEISHEIYYKFRVNEPSAASYKRQHVIMLTSWWARWRLKSPAYRLLDHPFVQAQIKENIKVMRVPIHVHMSIELYWVWVWIGKGHFHRIISHIAHDFDYMIMHTCDDIIINT